MDQGTYFTGRKQYFALCIGVAQLDRRADTIKMPSYSIVNEAVMDMDKKGSPCTT